MRKAYISHKFVLNEPGLYRKSEGKIVQEIVEISAGNLYRKSWYQQMCTGSQSYIQSYIHIYTHIHTYILM